MTFKKKKTKWDFKFLIQVRDVRNSPSLPEPTNIFINSYFLLTFLSKNKFYEIGLLNK